MGFIPGQTVSSFNHRTRRAVLSDYKRRKLDLELKDTGFQTGTS